MKHIKLQWTDDTPLGSVADIPGTESSTIIITFDRGQVLMTRDDNDGSVPEWGRYPSLEAAKRAAQTLL